MIDEMIESENIFFDFQLDDDWFFVFSRKLERKLRDFFDESKQNRDAIRGKLGKNAKKNTLITFDLNLMEKFNY